MMFILFVINFALIGSLNKERADNSSVLHLNSNLNEEPDLTFFDCTKKSCVSERTMCNEAGTLCICNPLYETINDGPFCNYERRSQLTAFLLELILGFGGGHFYTNRFLQASLKLVAFIIGIVLICTYPKITKYLSDDCYCELSILFFCFLIYCYTLGMSSWYIVDAVYYGRNLYPDGYGFALIRW